MLCAEESQAAGAGHVLLLHSEWLQAQTIAKMFNGLKHLKICNSVTHFWSSLLAKVDKTDVARQMVAMLHCSAEDRVQFQPLALQLHLQTATCCWEPTVLQAHKSCVGQS